MSHYTLDQIIMCPSLPSLPAVAVRLLELTGDPDVAMSDIAKLVQQDQALAAKVLKTVNSSFYGLSTPCSSIDRAMGYLGLNTVKSLVLGFSLVEATKEVDAGFDMESHWRRAIIGATGARTVAKRVGGLDPEDAFTASLFQDIGMLAFFMEVRGDYVQAIDGIAHWGLCKAERDKFGFDHTKVGSSLAARWKLPGEMVDAIRYHHDPESCQNENQHLARVVASGAMVCDCLAHDAPSSSVRKLERCLRQWFGTKAMEPQELLGEVKETSETLAKMFGQDIGSIPSTTELLARAQEQGLEHQLSMQREADQLAREALVDGLTQIANRKRFDAELKRVYNAFVSAGKHFGVIFFDADRFKGVNDTYGHAAGDIVLVELAKRATETIGEDGMVFRYGGEEFAVIVEGRSVDAVGALAERVREAFASKPFDLRSIEGAPDELSVTGSIGVSSTDAGNPSRLSGGEQVVHEADECVYAAKSDGRNNVKVFGRYSQVTVTTDTTPVAESESPTVSNADVSSSSFRILLVEDDALAATLVISLLKRRGKIEVEWVKSGTQACTLVEQGKLSGARMPSLILCDLNLPGCDGHEVLRVIRQDDRLSDVPFFMLTGNNDQLMRDESVRRGVSQFVHKDEFCADVNKWLGEIMNAGNGEVSKAA
ncbi:MAG: HDOD domain-containing protein [Phycisphaerales bacterium]